MSRLNKDTWVTSTRTSSQQNCVEIKLLENNFVGVRNSKDPNGGVLKFTPGEWNAFIAGAKDDEFDLETDNWM